MVTEAAVQGSVIVAEALKVQRDVLTLAVLEGREP